MPRTPTREPRRYGRDVARESILLKDVAGEIELKLAELPGRILTQLMLEGAASLLSRSREPRSTWLQWKQGLITQASKPRYKKRPKARQGPLGVGQRAIMLALAERPGCHATTAELEKFVRTLTATERVLWLKEPAVRLHIRQLTGAPPVKLDDLLERVRPIPEQKERAPKRPATVSRVRPELFAPAPP